MLQKHLVKSQVATEEAVYGDDDDDDDNDYSEDEFMTASTTSDSESDNRSNFAWSAASDSEDEEGGSGTAPSRARDSEDEGSTASSRASDSEADSILSSTESDGEFGPIMVSRLLKGMSVSSRTEAEDGQEHDGGDDSSEGGSGDGRPVPHTGSNSDSSEDQRITSSRGATGRRGPIAREDDRDAVRRASHGPVAGEMVQTKNRIQSVEQQRASKSTPLVSRFGLSLHGVGDMDDNFQGTLRSPASRASSGGEGHPKPTQKMSGLSTAEDLPSAEVKSPMNTGEAKCSSGSSSRAGRVPEIPSASASQVSRKRRASVAELLAEPTPGENRAGLRAKMWKRENKTEASQPAVNGRSPCRERPVAPGKMANTERGRVNSIVTMSAASNGQTGTNPAVRRPGKTEITIPGTWVSRLVHGTSGGGGGSVGGNRNGSTGRGRGSIPGEDEAESYAYTLPTLGSSSGEAEWEEEERDSDDECKGSGGRGQGDWGGAAVAGDDHVAGKEERPTHKKKVWRAGRRVPSTYFGLARQTNAKIEVLWEVVHKPSGNEVSDNGIGSGLEVGSVRKQTSNGRARHTCCIITAAP